MSDAFPGLGRDEPFARTWARRSVVIPAYLFVSLVLLFLTAPLLVLFVLTDLFRRRRYALVRSLLMLDIYLLAESVGTAASFAIWVRHAGWRRQPSAGYLQRNFVLQCRWASFLFWGARRIFALQVEIEGEELVHDGPLIVLARHSSPIDNLVPAVFISARHGMRLRWVINRWLRRDPCLDIVGSRLPNVFVDATREESGGQAIRVGALAEGLKRRDGLLIYPEGALYSPERRARIIERLAEFDPDASQRAHALRHVLPARGGGLMAGLAAAPEADVVLCRHTGLESTGNYRAFISGALVGARVRISFKRISRISIPDTATGQGEWLDEIWTDMDDWVATHLDTGGSVAPPVLGN